MTVSINPAGDGRGVEAGAAPNLMGGLGISVVLFV
jgi:hypothetical protein